jgi:signal recognition particle receptor subunit beta
MGLFNKGTGEVHLKIVYWGPENGGKTENIVRLRDFLKDSGKIVTLVGEDGSTIYFDFYNPVLTLPNGLKIKYLLYASPGKKAAKLARKLVLTGTDGIVFVVDSDERRFKDNKESLYELQELLKVKGLKDVPLVFQYNKRDLQTALPVEELRKELNSQNYPEIEAKVAEGVGVLETFREIARRSLINFLNRGNFGEIDFP